MPRNGLLVVADDDQYFLSLLPNKGCLFDSFDMVSKRMNCEVSWIDDACTCNNVVYMTYTFENKLRLWLFYVSKEVYFK